MKIKFLLFTLLIATQLGANKYVLFQTYDPDDVPVLAQLYKLSYEQLKNIMGDNTQSKDLRKLTSYMAFFKSTMEAHCTDDDTFFYPPDEDQTKFEIHDETLNQWLKDEKCGYIGLPLKSSPQIPTAILNKVSHAYINGYLVADSLEGVISRMMHRCQENRGQKDIDTKVLKKLVDLNKNKQEVTSTTTSPSLDTSAAN